MDVLSKFTVTVVTSVLWVIGLLIYGGLTLLVFFTYGPGTIFLVLASLLGAWLVGGITLLLIFTKLKNKNGF
jgi:hypothetical protein